MYLAALSVIQVIILPNPSLHLTPYTVCITDPQGSEWAMRGRGLGGGVATQGQRWVAAEPGSEATRSQSVI